MSSKIPLRIEINGVEAFFGEMSELQFNPGSQGVTVSAQYDPTPTQMEQLEKMAELRARFGADQVQPPLLSQNDSVPPPLRPVPDVPQRD